MKKIFISLLILSGFSLLSNAFERTSFESEEYPETLSGKTYVTTYTNGELDFNSWFTIEESGEGQDSFVIHNFAEGYDVTAYYDASVGKLTIPVGMVIGQYGYYGDVTLHSMDENGNVSDSDPVTGIVLENEIIFDNSVYTTIKIGTSDYDLTKQIEMKAFVANGTYSAVLASWYEVEGPLYVEKIDNDRINVIGINAAVNEQLFEYRHFGYYHPYYFSLDALKKTATSSLKDPIGFYTTNYGDFYYGMIVDGYYRDLQLYVNVHKGGSDLSTPYTTAWAYVNGNSYRHFKLSDVKISINFDIFADDDDNGDLGGMDKIEISNPENGPIRYFNLQGTEVKNPSNGVFLKMEGSKVSKVLK